MFRDLHFPYNDIDLNVHRERLCCSTLLGYQGVAVVHINDRGRILENERNTICPLSREALSAGGSSVQLLLQLKSSSAFRPDSVYEFPQLSRLHLVTDEAAQAQSLGGNPQITKSYNIISIQTKSEKVLQQACNSLDVDLITLDLSQNLSFKIKPQVLKPAVNRGVYFEILYASALRDATSRRRWFANVQMLTRALRGRNIVISSGARQAFDLRSPFDVISMAGLLGLTPEQAKAAITVNCDAVIAHAAKRQLVGGVVQIVREVPESIASPNVEDKKQSNAEHSTQAACVKGKRRRSVP